MAASWLSDMALVPLSVSMSRKIVARAKQECVVTRLLHSPQPLANRGQPHLLHNPDFVHFDRNFSSVG